MPSTTLHTRLLWTGAQEQPGLLRDAILEVDDGQIQSIRADEDPKKADQRFDALLPPLVNAHCHLEFSHLQESFEERSPFTSWSGQTMQARQSNTHVEAPRAQGVGESEDAGVQLIADILTHNSTQDLSTNRCAVIPFRELIGVTEERVRAQIETMRQFLDQHSGPLGLSPHAPYSVRPDLLEKCVETSRERGVPLMMHLAETHSELEFLSEGTGEFVEMLERFGIWGGPFHAKGTRPLDLLKQLSSASRVLLAHCNYLDADEIDLLSHHRNMHVVYCPRTHAYFGHAPHPWPRMLEKGINVALGTDGRGSNPDLSIWNEVRFLAQSYPDVSPAAFVRMATINGGRALKEDLTIRTGGPARFTALMARDKATSLTDWPDLLQPDVSPTSLIP